MLKSLASHLISAVNQESALLRILGLPEVSLSTNWTTVAESACVGSLSSSEQSMAMCLCALAGVTVPESFGYWFSGLSGDQMRVIVSILESHTVEVEGAEQAGRAMLGL